MKIINNFGKLDKLESDIDASCIGAFDGIHLGHQQLINETKKISNNFQIITFDQVPKIKMDKRRTTGPYNSRKLRPLINPHLKNDLFKSFKPKNLIYLDFIQISSMLPEQFIDFLINNLNTRKIVVGNDFKFGSQRSGNIQSLINKFGESNVHLVEDFLIDNQKVSSTKIRDFLDIGNIEKVNNLLGREYEISGTVYGGNQFARELGFPTANILLGSNLPKSLDEDQIIYLPKNGVYGVTCLLGNKKYDGILNIMNNSGTRNHNDNYNIEVHIFDFDEDIYEKEIKVYLNTFVRETKTFNSNEEAIKQISNDINSLKKN